MLPRRAKSKEGSALTQEEATREAEEGGARVRLFFLLPFLLSSISQGRRRRHGDESGVFSFRRATICLASRRAGAPRRPPSPLWLHNPTRRYSWAGGRDRRGQGRGRGGGRKGIRSLEKKRERREEQSSSWLPLSLNFLREKQSRLAPPPSAPVPGAQRRARRHSQGKGTIRVSPLAEGRGAPCSRDEAARG